MILFLWRCWLQAVWYAITNPPTLSGPFAGAFISGHSWVATEDMAVPAYVDVLRCEDCGAINVGWRRSYQNRTFSKGEGA